MAATSIRGTTTVASDHGGDLVIRGIRSGLIGSLAMAMVMMVLGLFDKGFFAAPSAIWAFWAGPAAYAPTTISLGFVLGAMGHMMSSLVLGIVFALLAGKVLRLEGALATAMAGVVYGLLVMAAMWLIVLPLGAGGAIVRDSAATWIWALGHVAYGTVTALLFARWR